MYLPYKVEYTVINLTEMAILTPWTFSYLGHYVKTAMLKKQLTTKTGQFLNFKQE